MALTDLQRRKLHRAFSQVDIDDNGYIERDDVLGLGARLLVNFAEAPTSLKGKVVIDRFHTLWDTMVDVLDKDGDGRLSPTEYTEGIRQAFIDGPHFDEVFHPTAASIVDLCDTDGDGLVGFEEFRAMQEAFGTSSDDTHQAFSDLDLDGNGALTTDELAAAVRTFFTSDDPGATGNLLFGPVR